MQAPFEQDPEAAEHTIESLPAGTGAGASINDLGEIL
jgi:hypothetical protein